MVINGNLRECYIIQLSFKNLASNECACHQRVYTRAVVSIRVVVDGDVSEWIPFVSGVPWECALGTLLFILYIMEMFELVENRLYAYADESILLAVVTRLGFRSGAITGALYKTES